MSIGSFFLSRFYRLPPKLNDVRRKRSVALPMGDEVTLMTDVYAPKSPGPHPTILMRLGTATRMIANDIEIFHAPERESRIALACYDA